MQIYLKFQTIDAHVVQIVEQSLEKGTYSL